MKHTKRGFLASLGAVATATALMLGGVTSAQAQNTLDVPTEGDVTITKLAQPKTIGDPATGLVPEGDLPADATPIADVGFEAQLVDGTQLDGANDIGTNTGQQYVAGLDSTQDVEDDLVATDFDGVTDDNGVLSWNDMPRGLYVVSETSTPAGVVPAQDFFVAVPLTNPEGPGWLSTINVYPKNAQIYDPDDPKNPWDPEDPDDPNRPAQKTVDNADALTVGSDVTWTIDTGLPRIVDTRDDAEQTYRATTAFEIHDTLNNAELDLLEDDNGDYQITVEADGVTEEDYEVIVEEGEETTQVRVVFNESGRQALATAVSDADNARVLVTLETEVLASDVIGNQAQIFVDQTAIDNDSPLETNTAEIAYGDYQFRKTSGDDEPLAGATFRVYANQADANDRNDNYLRPASNSDGEWESAEEDGQITIEGLRYSDVADDQELDAQDRQTYYLVEVEAPAGYQMLAEPLEFHVDQDSGDSVQQDVVNISTAEGGFQLPLTGGMGTTVLTILGIGILVAVIFLARRRRAMTNAS